MPSYTLRHVPVEVWRELKARAAFEGLSLQTYIVRTLEAKLLLEREKDTRAAE